MGYIAFATPCGYPSIRQFAPVESPTSRFGSPANNANCNCLVQSRTYAETEGRDSEIAPTVGNSVETCNKLHYYELTYAL